MVILAVPGGLAHGAHGVTTTPARRCARRPIEASAAAARPAALDGGTAADRRVGRWGVDRGVDWRGQHARHTAGHLGGEVGGGGLHFGGAWAWRAILRSARSPRVDLLSSLWLRANVWRAWARHHITGLAFGVSRGARMSASALGSRGCGRLSVGLDGRSEGVERGPRAETGPEQTSRWRRRPRPEWRHAAVTRCRHHVFRPARWRTATSASRPARRSASHDGCVPRAFRT